MIDCLQKIINNKREEVIGWVDDERKKVTLPVYSSFDIRDNGTKATIVDSNLYPAGFNNLTFESRKLASNYFEKFFHSFCETKNILIIPEAHTRNLHYLSNLTALKDILSDAGFNVTLGSVREDIDEVMKVEDSDGRVLILEKMRNDSGRLKTKSFESGCMLLNNDFSVEAPKLLQNVKDHILPPLKLGWMHRKKSNHFNHFCALINDFGKRFDIDPWLLCPHSEAVDNINFSSGKNIDKVGEIVDKSISQIQKKYDEYNIKEKPYVFVKDNSGTYGMGILTAHSGKEIMELNSKQRRKMKSGKEKRPINSVLVQEGISTKYKVNGSSAEPVLYAVGGRNVGGFMRIHNDKDSKTSLNAPGAKFDVLLESNLTKPIINQVEDNTHISLYTILANLANIAIGKEMEELK